MSRRPWLPAALPSVPAPEAGGGGAPAPAPAPGAPLQPPIPAPAGTNPPAPAPAPAPAPEPYVEREGSADTSPEVRMSQQRLSNRLAKEAADGARKLVRDRFGVDKLEDLEPVVQAGRAALQQQNPPAGGGDAALQAQLEAERAARRASDERFERAQDDQRVAELLRAAGCTLPAAAIAELRGTEQVQVGADGWQVQAAIERVKARAPQLFTTAPVPPPPAVPGQQPAPAAAVPGATPIPAAPADPGNPPTPAPAPAATGFGARGRAEAERRHPKPPPSS